MIVTIGGMPNLELVKTRQDAANSINARCIATGGFKPASFVLIYDESGDSPALPAVDIAANARSKV